MRVLAQGDVVVYIYPGDHPPPHCHVRYRSGKELRVTIPFLDVLTGGRMEKRVRRLLRNNIDLLVQEWENLNE